MKKRTQIGGNHYEMAIEPITFIELNKLSFSEGNVVKYICRHRFKNGKQDLLKAIDYINRIIEFDYPEQVNKCPNTASVEYEGCVSAETDGDIIPFMCE